MTYCGVDYCKECSNLSQCGGCEQCAGHCNRVSILFVLILLTGKVRISMKRWII